VWTRRPYTYFEYGNAKYVTYLRQAIAEAPPALVHMDSLDLYRWLAELPPEVPTVCTHHNIESALLRSRAARVKHGILAAYLRHQAELVERVERVVSERFQANIVMSELDGERLRGLAPGAKTFVAPTGVDTEYFAPPAPAVVPGRVAFLGPTYMFPNQEGVDFFIREAWPAVRRGAPGATFHLIGRSTPALAARYASVPGVTCLGYVPDVRPHLAAASCLVVPLRVGGGTRIKILDSWAMGKAVVSTALGCEGLRASDGENMLIRDTATGLADAVLQVLGNAALRTRLEQRARATAVETYSWDALGQKLRVEYGRLIDGRRESRDREDSLVVTRSR
jgi:glycosyltransferase involved in cell wall biosynthesis